MKVSLIPIAHRPDLQLNDVWEEISVVGGDRVADPPLISTIEGETVSCVDASLPTRSTARQHLRGDRGDGRGSRRGSQPSLISTIGGKVASCTAASSPTKSTARRRLGGDRGGGRGSRHGFQPSPISTI
ncbi:hypothetical protein TIFTF001_010543 [Ficus carica]|uniref:Uncharacterized protein n=1 Tax=Ficus carica TaxID=3494 RepID=A0AA88A8T6_FICCA|nr:hypothetical protein TIFTF001_010543 [Ficus carica]